MPGTPDDPVVLDPWTDIIEVGWPGLDLLIVDVIWNEAVSETPPKTAIWMNRPGAERWPGAGTPDAWPDADAGPNDYVVGNEFFGSSFAGKSVGRRTDPPDDDLSLMEGLDESTGPRLLPTTPQEFFSKYYFWHCGQGDGAAAPRYSAALINVKKLRADYLAGEGLDRGDDPQGSARVPTGGVPLKTMRVDVILDFLDGANAIWRVRGYKGGGGSFTQTDSGLVTYDGDGVVEKMDSQKQGTTLNPITLAQAHAEINLSERSVFWLQTG